MDDRAARHAKRVLRLRPGDSLTLFNGNGRDYEAVMQVGGGSGTTVHLTGAGEPEPPPRLRTHLWLGISKGERMDFALQKAVELGCSSLTPVQTARGVVKLQADRLDKRLAHWQGVILSACEQSGRRTLPPLRPPVKLAALLSSRPANGIVLALEAQRSLAELEPPEGEVTLLIGPEGGLTDAERASAVAAGFATVRLGPRVLRTETAPLAALAAIQALWGDFRD